MKENLLYRIILILICIMQITFAFAITANKNPGKMYLFAYSSTDGNSGLNLAWSVDKETWHGIGANHRFLFSDFGMWGPEKRMHTPYLFRDKENLWHCVWSLNDEVGAFAHAASKNLYEWKRQNYPQIMKTGNFQEPEVFFDASENKFIISWLSNTGENKSYEAYQTTTSDFKTFSKSEKVDLSTRKNERVEISLNGNKQRGIIYEVSSELVYALIKHEQWEQFHNKERDEKLNDDPSRFKDLKPFEASIALNPEKSKPISDLLIGVFFEDINYAADGGLYAELIQNRDFEYNIADTKGTDKNWNSKKAWSVNTDAIDFTIATKNPIHQNNPNYAILEVLNVGSGLANEGFGGIPIKKEDTYDFSIFAHNLGRTQQALIIRLKTKEGKIIGETTVKNIDNKWQKYEAVIKAKETVSNAVLEIIPTSIGKIALDMISLFPQKTFKNRKNGLRADLAQTIADLNPKFVRFPGGCVAHGDGLDNMYRWQNTVGPLEVRVPQPNIWKYHQTAGLGYFEYFQFCEDINAEPLPVLPAGVPCQNSSTGGHGQQCGIPMDDMDDYVQEVLNLIEWANGDKNTKWGKIRAAAGHPKPFNLKYIGIGNEDLITDVFEERFTMIFNALKEKHPEITVIGTVGPTYRGTDYEEGWDIADKLNIPIVDEHYYQPPGWFINNQDYYDKYDRSKSKVYLGEYAAHISGRRMNIQTALCEALYLASVERNADVVTMTSFAPLLAKEGSIQWNPDLIYFNNTEVKPTVDYYVQKLYGTNSGDKYIPSDVKFSNNDKNVTKRIGISIVQDSKTGDLILKLVNLLPVSIDTDLNFDAYSIEASTGLLTVLKGDINDENQKPSTTKIALKNKMEYQLPPYSFSVLRIESNKI